MKKQILLKASVLILIVTMSVVNAFGQLASWQLNAAAGNEATIAPTYTNSHVTVDPLARGAGIVGSALLRGFAATEFSFTAGTPAVAGTKADAITNADYFQTALTVQSGYNMSLFNIDFRLRRSAAGPNAFRWMYSKNGGTFADLGSADVSFTSTVDGVDQVQIILSDVSELQNLTATDNVVLRLYAWGGTTNTGTFAIGRYATGDLSPSLAIGGRIKPVSAVSLLGWTFTGPSTNGDEATLSSSSNNIGVNSSLLSRGAGVPGSSTVTLPRSFVGADFSFTAGTPVVAGTKADALANGDYYQFTVTPATGYLTSLATLDARLRRSGAGANTYRWSYSLDGTNFTEVGTSDASVVSTYDGVDQPQIELSSITALQNLTSTTTVTFRIYAWGATTATGTFAIGRFIGGTSINSLEVQGTSTLVMPLALIGSINAVKSNSNIIVSWKTANEINVDKFTIEKSADARNFVAVGSVTANNTASNTYSFTDKNNNAGVIYYRLKMIDKDGSFKYSSIATVKNDKGNTIAVYPNPVNDNATVQHANALSNASVSIADVTGKIIKNYVVTAGSTQTMINTVMLAKGTYTIIFNNNGVKQSTQLQKL